MPEVSQAPLGDTYSMSLVATTISATQLASTLKKLAIGKDGFVRAYVDSSNLSAGRYRVTLRRENAQESDDFLILFTKPAAIPHAD
jgi:hypothetical protein